MSFFVTKLGFLTINAEFFCTVVNRWFYSSFCWNRFWLLSLSGSLSSRFMKRVALLQTEDICMWQLSTTFPSRYVCCWCCFFFFFPQPHFSIISFFFRLLCGFWSFSMKQWKKFWFEWFSFFPFCWHSFFFLFFLAWYQQHQHRPLAKFMCVKAIVFFSYWQSIIIAIMVHFGWLIQEKDDWSISDVVCSNLVLHFPFLYILFLFTSFFVRCTGNGNSKLFDLHRNASSGHCARTFIRTEILPWEQWNGSIPSPTDAGTANHRRCQRWRCSVRCLRCSQGFLFFFLPLPFFFLNPFLFF